MKAKEYNVLCMAVGEGVRYGIRRHFKHKDECPTDEQIEALALSIEDQVVNAICEWFDFKEEADE